MICRVFRSNRHPSGELWVSDGTEAGTRLLKSIGADASGYLSDLTAFQGKLYFVGNDQVHGDELWVSDGTGAGTQMLKEIQPGWKGYLSALQVVGNKLYFKADDGIHGVELWTSDGTITGTRMVKDINPGAQSSDLYIGNGIDNLLYFTVNDKVHGDELWVSDGTEAGTRMLKDIRPGAIGSFARYLQVMNDKLYFQANDGVHGAELWVSDGTATGTRMVKDVQPGAAGSYPYSFTSFRGKVYFTAYDSVHGYELWVSDDTEAGTRMVQDANPGKAGILPHQLKVFNNKLYFQGFTEAYGRELFVYEPSVTITGFTPKSGIVGTEVIISGVNFDAVATNNIVRFNGVAANVTSATITELKVAVPQGATTGKITVEIGSKTAHSATDFVVLLHANDPAIVDFSPKSGSNGTEVTISGVNFDAVAANNVVRFNGVVTSVISATTTELKVTVPTSATTGRITVKTVVNIVTSSEDFTVTTPTGLASQPNKGNLTLYPNPATNMLGVRLEGKATSAINVTVYNIFGQAVLQTTQILQNGECRLNIASFPAGKYLVQIQWGQEVIGQTIIKK